MKGVLYNSLSIKPIKSTLIFGALPAIAFMLVFGVSTASGSNPSLIESKTFEKNNKRSLCDVSVPVLAEVSYLEHWATAYDSNRNCGTYETTKTQGKQFSALSESPLLYPAPQACTIACLSDLELFLRDQQCSFIYNSDPPQLIDCSLTDYTLEYEIYFPAGSSNMIGSGEGGINISLDAGMTEVIYTLLDENLDVLDECNFLIEVVDSFIPELLCADTLDYIVDGTSQCDIFVDLADFLPIIDDNCEDQNVIQFFVELPDGTESSFILNSTFLGYRFELGINQLKFLVTDPAGNLDSCGFNIVVKDETAPEILTCPSPQEIVVSPGSCESIVNIPSLILSPNPCNDASIQSYTITPGNFRGTPPANRSIPTGQYKVQYEVVDLSGNKDTCSYDLIVKDRGIPQIIGCPDDVVEHLDSGCEKRDTIDLPLELFDDCMEEVFVRDSVIKNMTFDADNKAEAMTFSFTRSDLHAFTAIRLQLFVWGDVDNSAERFAVYGEDIDQIGTTNSALGANCENASLSTIEISASELKSWLEDGRLDFQLVPTEIGVVESEGSDPDKNSINNYCPSNTSGTPRVLALLSYPRITDFEYKVYGVKDTSDFVPIQLNAPNLYTFGAGSNMVEISYADKGGNTALCRYKYMLVDSMLPSLVCDQSEAMRYSLNADGTESLILDPSMFDFQAFDNCGIADTLFSPAVLDCSNAQDSPVSVNIIVEDENGNREQCEVFVDLEINEVFPDYNRGVCEGDDLKLFMDPDISASSASLSFEWFDPLGQSFSNLENPTIINADIGDAGEYELRVTSDLTSCIAYGYVDVQINAMPGKPSIRSSNSEYCLEEEVLLTTDLVSGVDFYRWYVDVGGSAQLVDSTTIPEFRFLASSLGINNYYVDLVSGNCNSEISDRVEFAVNDKRIIDLGDQPLIFCEGDSLILDNSIVSTLFVWEGPNNFSSNEQSPLVTEQATMDDSGWYRLRVIDGDCFSNFDSILVSITEKPQMPTILFEDIICPGEDLVLNCDIGNGDEYQWHMPSGGILNSSSSTIIVPSADLVPGEYAVVVIIDGCASDISDPRILTIQQDLNLNIQSNNPLCDGESLSLSADEFQGMTYEWIGPGFSFMGRETTVDDPITGKYILTGITEENCFFYDSIEVVIYDQPELLGINSNILSGECLNGTDSLVLSAQLGLNTGGVMNYTWMDPDGQIFTSEDLILLNADTSVNGVYTLTIESEFGCSSEERSIELNFLAAPNAPVIVFSDPVCEGEELVISSSIRMGTNVVYEWSTPLGERTSLGPNLIFNNANPNDHRGEYQVRVSVDNCRSAYSNPVSIDIFDKPSQPVISGRDSYCSGDTVLLTTDLLPNLDYFWQYPGSSSDTNFVLIPSANASHSGEYVLQVENEFGCLSDASVTEITISNRLEKPILVSNSPICSEDELLLQVSSSFADSIVWISPTGRTYSSTDQEIRFDNNSIEAGEWTARAYLGSCSSEISDPIEILVDQEYFINISANNPLCETDTLRLSATFIENSSYLWRNGNGMEIANSRDFMIVNPSSGRIKLEWESPLGCAQDDSIDIIVNRIPIVDSIVFQGDQCVDGNQHIELIPFINSGFGNHSFTWSGPLVNGVDSVLIIDNVSIDDAGDYFLEVYNENNCSSGLIKYELELNSIPPLPVIRQDRVICEGDSIHLSTDNYNDPTTSYQWTHNGTNYRTSTPEFKLPNSEYLPGMAVQLQILTDECSSPLSLEFYPTITLVPDMPDFSYPSFICDGDTLFLSAEEVQGASYIWEGPMSFSSSLREPAIPMAGEENEGYYRVRLIIGGCSSVFSDSVFIEVRENPTTPEIKLIEDLCIDQGDRLVTVEIETAGRMPGELYYIFNDDGSTALDNPFGNGFVEISIDSFEIGSNSVYVTAENGGCFSGRSDLYEFNVFTVPDTFFAEVGDDLILCEDNKLLRAINLPQDDENYSGMWRQVSGPNPVRLFNSTSAVTEMFFGDLVGGEEYLFEWSVSYGTCVNYSTDTISVYKVNTGQTAIADPLITICNLDSVFLSARAPTGLVEGYWSQNPFQEQTLGVVIVDPSDPNTLVRNLVPGNTYYFTWNLTHPECEPNIFDQATVEVRVNFKEPCDAFAGLDQDICGEPTVVLNAGSSGECSGIWSTLGNANLSDPFNADSEAHDLEVGENYFIYTLSDLQCRLFDQDTVIVSYYLGVDAEGDNFDIDFAGFETIDILDNDFGVENSVIEILSDPSNGRIELSDTEIMYFADVGYIGPDEFTYQLCDLRCPDYCDTARVTITVGDDLDCTIPTLITPNNDNTNDAFIIPCLASPDYPNNSVTIFNQWGDEVFQASPYLNDWKGDYKGEALNDGTYFYLVNFGTGVPTESGFLIIQR